VLARDELLIKLRLSFAPTRLGCLSRTGAPAGSLCLSAPEPRRIAPGFAGQAARDRDPEPPSLATSQAAAVKRIQLAREQAFVRPQGDQRTSIFLLSRWMKSA